MRIGVGRRVKPPQVKGRLDLFLEEAEEALRKVGRWEGCWSQALELAQEKLNRQSQRDRERSSEEGWDSPDALLQRWARLHRATLQVDQASDRFRVEVPLKTLQKSPEAELPVTRGLFDDLPV